MAPAPSATPQLSQFPPGTTYEQLGYCKSLPEPYDSLCINAVDDGGPSAFSLFSSSMYLKTHLAQATVSSPPTGQPATATAATTSSSNPAVQFSTVTPASSRTTSPLGSSNTGGFGGGSWNYPKPDSDHHKNSLPSYLLAAAVIIPLVILGFLVAAIITIVRRKKKQRRIRAGDAAQMKEVNPNRVNVESAYIRPPSSEPPPATVAAAANNSVPPTNRASQPVILSSTMDGAYYTGLDTADHISLVSERSRTSDPFADGDEPPPPYRPRSVPPISRETSVRTAFRNNSVSRNPSQRTYRNDPLVSNGLMGSIRHSQDNPFNDPDGDDAISEISTIHEVPRGEGDQLSVVSDLSYQEEPVIGRSTV